MKTNNDEFDALLVQATKVKEKIIKVDGKLKIQLSEINKSELLIEQLRECYSQQKQTFNKLLDNKEVAIKELNQLITTMRNIDNTFDVKNSDLLIENSTVEGERQQKLFIDDSKSVLLPNVKRNLSENDVEMTSPKKIFVGKAESEESCSRLKYPLVVTENPTQTITKILFSNNALFVCGSGGLLMRFSNEERKTFHTNTREVIRNMTVLERCLVAFTDYNIILFANTTDTDNGLIKKCKSFIGQIHLYHSSIYIPLANGEVWNFNMFNQDYQKCFSESGEISAILKYKTFIVLLKKDGRVLQRISSRTKEIEDLRGSMSIGSISSNLWYSYNDSQLWIVSHQESLISKPTIIEKKIHLASCNTEKMVILDKANNLQLYTIENNHLNLINTVCVNCKEINTLTITDKNEIFVAEKNKILHICV